MKIDRHATIGGQPVKLVRQLMRDHGWFDIEGILAPWKIVYFFKQEGRQQ